MRTGYLVALLSSTALFLSGCSSVDRAEVVALASADNSPTGTTGTSPTGNSTGTSTGQTVSAGSTTFAFNDSSFSTGGNGQTGVNLTNAGGAIGTPNVETATVSVNTGFTGMTWADPIEMALFTTTVNPFGLNDLQNSPGFSGYKEYRRINSTTDAELQIWNYQFSRVGQYTVYFDPTAGNNNNVALFHDGDLTPTSGLPAATATYNGKFGGTAVTSNWIVRPRVVDDPFVADPAHVAGEDWDPNGTWRVTGDVQVNANFGAGSVTGGITNTTWIKFLPEVGYIGITPAETSRPFHDYTFNGTITDNKFTGTTRGPNGVVTGNNALDGAFYGPNAEEVAGVVYSETTSVSPGDGQIPYEENRRGFITLRGVFHGGR